MRGKGTPSHRPEPLMTRRSWRPRCAHGRRPQAAAMGPPTAERAAVLARMQVSA